MPKVTTHKLDIDTFMQDPIDWSKKPDTREERIRQRIRKFCDQGRPDLAEKMYDATVKHEMKRGKGKLSKGFEWIDRVKAKKVDDDEVGLPGP